MIWSNRSTKLNLLQFLSLPPSSCPPTSSSLSPFLPLSPNPPLSLSFIALSHRHSQTHARTHTRTHTCAREEEADSSNKNCEITLKFWRPSAHFARVGAEAKIVKRRSVVVPLNPALPQHFLLRWPVLAFKETMHDHSKRYNLLLPRTNAS